MQAWQWISVLCSVAIVMLCTFCTPRNDNSPVTIQKTSGLWGVVLISAAGLYLELLLIRWLGTEIRIFAYVQNLVLIACFVGFGIGCFTSGKPDPLAYTLNALVILGVVVSLPVVDWKNFLMNLSNLMTISSDTVLWGGTGTYPFLTGIYATFLVGIMLWLIITAMIPLGQAVGLCFDQSSNVTRTYSANLIGSLIGTWILVLLSVFNLPPGVWVVCAFAMIIAIMPKSRRNVGYALALMVLAVVIVQVDMPGDKTHWSPYQKLTVSKLGPDGQYQLNVNNVGYMTMANMTPAYLEKHPKVKAQRFDSSYDSPFRFITKKDDVLIVGAGGGNDAAAALRNGAKHIDAVEIDPMIYKLGKKYHPDHPYASDKVNVIINDARNYLRKTDKKYDVIVFGLLDSHTGPSGYSNLRVDNYVYTHESLARARELLKPDGVMVLKFEVRQPWTWIGQRFYGMLTDIFDHEPVAYMVNGIDYMWPATEYLESNGKQLWQVAKKPELKKFVSAHPPVFKAGEEAMPAPATDDWPYIYSKERTIPRAYIVVSIVLLLLSAALLRKNLSFKPKSSFPMLFLGAAFMLMETQLINRLTLYFGTTWIVSSIVISMLLVFLVMANFFVEKMRNIKSLKPCYAVLLISVAANYFFPWESLPYQPWVVGLLLSGAFSVSIFLSGIIFTSTLQVTEKKSTALGMNILGAVIGGFMQNMSFVLGLKALLPIAGLFYLAAAVSSGKMKKLPW